MPPAAIQRVENLLDQRPGLRIQAEWGHVSTLVGGGHICEFVWRQRSEVNPLWRPPWPTIDPGSHSGEHEEIYGPAPDGRLLAGIAGHSLSFDHFGPPSVEETAAGLSTHGEAPVALWQVHRECQAEVEYGAVLPVSQIDFRRTLTVDTRHPVFYCEEEARNLSAADRPICWNEHVTIGPPFLACETTLVDMPAVESKVISATYSDRMIIVPDACFRWPSVPTPSGAVHDLRTTPEGRYCRYTAQLLDRTLKIAYIAIANPLLGLLLIYIFRRADFPWVGNWEERFHHTNAPWGGKTFCRGIEFSSTPFAIAKRDVISQGPLFHESTYRWLPARNTVAVRFVALLMEIPSDFTGVEHLTAEQGEVRTHERGTTRVFSQFADTAFL